MNFACKVITDLVNPRLKMFHYKKQPPTMVTIVTSNDPSEVTCVCLARLTEYLAKFITPSDFCHHMTDSILTKKGDTLDLDENTIIIRLGYDNEELQRSMTLQLTLEKANMRLH